MSMLSENRSLGKFLHLNHVFLTHLSLCMILFLTVSCGKSEEPVATRQAPGEQQAVAVPSESTPAPVAEDMSSPASEHGSATAPEWNIDQERSTLGFIGDYAGTEFRGEFRKFSAVIQFDPEQPETGHFDVTIDVKSVTTYNDDWDEVISYQEWFNSSEYPVSKYVTRSITPLEDDKYLAVGTLDLKGNQRDVELRFVWTKLANGEASIKGQARMLGAAEVDRREFNIGEGSWAEDDTVAFNIHVEVNLLLNPAEQN